jgi:tetratricopeptide (TPR) repeat protein
MAALTKLERDVAAGCVDAAKAMSYVIGLEALVMSMGIPLVVERAGRARQNLSKHLPEWSHMWLMAESEEVDRRYDRGDRQGALDAARALRDRAETAGDVFPEAAYDRAIAWLKFGRMLGETGHAQEALGVLDVAQGRFAELAKQGDQRAAGMNTKVLAERGDALSALGRLDEAAAAYEDSAQRAKALGDLRAVAVASSELGSVRLLQGRLDEALAAYQETRSMFEALGEPGVVAAIWHQIGMAHAQARNIEAAERAYKEALKLEAMCGDRDQEATTLHQLGSLYNDQGRLEDAASLFRQAAEKFHTLGNKSNESMSLNGLGVVLAGLHRFDEARDAITTALTLMKLYGHSAEPWRVWCALEDVEREAGRPEAAREARWQALQTYRAYRLDGGEPVDSPTQFIASFGQTLRTSGPDAARALLARLTQVPEQFVPALRALKAFAAGSRDPALADDPAIDPIFAAELALLVESLPPA